jgi:hypothetical protein
MRGLAFWRTAGQPLLSRTPINRFAPAYSSHRYWPEKGALPSSSWHGSESRSGGRLPRPAFLITSKQMFWQFLKIKNSLQVPQELTLYGLCTPARFVKWSSAKLRNVVPQWSTAETVEVEVTLWQTGSQSVCPGIEHLLCREDGSAVSNAITRWSESYWDFPDLEGQFYPWALRLQRHLLQDPRTDGTYYCI